MTGASLGLRTPSYGSLLQQQQQQQQQHQQLLLLQAGAAVPIQVTPGSIRKQSKMLASGAREKEKLLPWICRIAGRRGVGMLLLAVISLAVFVSILSAFNKDEDVSEGPEMNWKHSQSFPIITNSPLLIKPDDNHKMNETFVPETQMTNREREFHDHLLFVNKSVLPPIHPCESFALPPPPADKKRTGPRPCDVCYVPFEHAIPYMPVSPSISPVLKDLTYFSEGNIDVNGSNGGSSFSGHPSLEHRNESFDIRESMSVHCGFFNGARPGVGSGFDIDETDLFEMEKCHGVVVASAIFGNYDILQHPKNVGELTIKTACFYMFVDEETISYIKNSTTLNDSNRVGLWRIVVVRNLPYTDARRNGKVPKLLLHRLFPNARYSLWIDGKLELAVDPYQILERFLWRKNATFAISRHYRRFDVFVEAEANKAAGKYDNASIDNQINFYKNEGLTPYSEAKLPITSDVPEGCVIIKEHIPITNLFTCLWFNEVDRFTSRDQLSFSTVRDKIMSKVNWSIEMFLDCERRNFVIQAYHRDLLEQMMHSPPPPLLIARPSRKILPDPVPDRLERTPPPIKKPPAKRGRDRRSGPRRRHPKIGNGKDNNSI